MRVMLCLGVLKANACHLVSHDSCSFSFCCLHSQFSSILTNTFFSPICDLTPASIEAAATGLLTAQHQATWWLPFPKALHQTARLSTTSATQVRRAFMFAVGYSCNTKTERERRARTQVPYSLGTLCAPELSSPILLVLPISLPHPLQSVPIRGARQTVSKRMLLLLLRKDQSRAALVSTVR